MPETTEVLHFKEYFKFESIETLLDKIKDTLEEMGVKTVIRKKVFNVMVECLENIHKYSALGVEDDYTVGEFLPEIIVKMTEDYFLLTFSNAVLSTKIESITNKNDEVNKLDKEGLKMLYESVINNTIISEKGGAGLGTILSAMISGNKLDYSFKKIDEIYSYYTLQITIPLQKI